MRQQNITQWYTRKDRQLWTAQDILCRVPSWIIQHSQDPVNGGWLRALALPISPTFAGSLTDRPNMVRMAHALNGVEKMFGQKDLSRVWESYFPLLSPSGQLKNFFVATATVMQAPPGKYSIMLAGSKAALPSGMWHEQFCYFLLRAGYSGRVDAFDSSQETVHWRYSYEGREVVFQGHSRLLSDNELGQNYDIVIDDIYREGPSARKWQSKYWSTKDHTPGCKTFFHDTEGRVFSHNFQIRPALGSCKCYRCSIEEQFNFPQYVAEAITSQIEAHFCKGTIDQSFIADINNRLHRLPAVSVQSPAEVRAVIAQSHTAPIRATTPEKVAYVPPHKRREISKEQVPVIPYNRRQGFQTHANVVSDAQYFVGKYVRFFGVSPSVLEGIEINSKKGNIYWSVADIGFFAENPTLHSLLTVKEIWFEGVLPFAGFRRTGRTFRGYIAYRRITVPYKKEVSPFVSGVENFIIYDGDQPLCPYVGPQSFQSIGIEISATVMTEFVHPTRPNAFDISRYLRRSGKKYCKVHHYVYPDGWHDCSKSMCKECGRAWGSCPHYSSRFKCTQCTRDLLIKEYTSSGICLQCKNGDSTI